MFGLGTKFIPIVMGMFIILGAGFLVIFKLLETPVKDPGETSVPEPTQKAKIPIAILVLKYFPLSSGTQNLDPTITGMSSGLASIRAKVDRLTNDGIDVLEKGSTYHGYKDGTAISSLDYFIFDSIEFISAMPVSNNEIPWKPGQGIYRPDYMQMLNSVNICDYVDNQDIKQVWVWGYHFGNIEPVEANMAMGISSRAYWNYGTYGDVSNSEETNDLPTCSKTYTLYNYNYGRQVGEMIENHGHQIEAVLKFVDPDLFWNKFVGPYGTQTGDRRCGWTHYTPNGNNDYDWQNENAVLSDCEDWKPDGTGEKKLVDCHTWHGTTCADDGGVNFKRWWMQNIPGQGNTLIYQDNNLRDWWEFYGDFDEALNKGKSLIIESAEATGRKI